MEFDQGVVHLCMPDPDGRLQQEWDPAALNFSADFLSMFHVLLALPVNLTDSALFIILCPIADMYLMELLDEATLHCNCSPGIGCRR